MYAKDVGTPYRHKADVMRSPVHVIRSRMPLIPPRTEEPWFAMFAAEAVMFRRQARCKVMIALHFSERRPRCRVCGSCL